MTPEQIKEMVGRLKEPFSPDAISWRVGNRSADKQKGLALAYIDARDVMDRLDEVVGPENWQDKYEWIGNRTVCTISIRCGEGGDWVDKSDGAGDTDIEGEKGGISDAFKRCAVKWGIGRYLYRLDSPWVALTNEGRSIASHEYARLRAILGGKEDVPTTPPMPSKQAVGIADGLKSCTTIIDLQNAWAASSKIIKGLHMVDKRYLDEVKEKLKKALTGAELAA